MFQKFLEKDDPIALYDVKNEIYLRKNLKYQGAFYINFFAVSVLINTPFIPVSIINLYLMAKVVKANLDWSKIFVQKIVFDPKQKKFEITKRGFFGGLRTQDVNVDDMMYTQDQNLWALDINYINMETKECYSIPFLNAWKNKELFSYLIRQNVHGDIHVENIDTR